MDGIDELVRPTNNEALDDGNQRIGRLDRSRRNRPTPPLALMGVDHAVMLASTMAANASAVYSSGTMPSAMTATRASGNAADQRAM
jgi:hypothetical protein